MIAFLLVATLAAAPAKPCVSTAKEAAVFLEYEINAARDVFGVRVCLATLGTTKAGSFHIDVLYDSVALRVNSVKAGAAAGAQASNPNKAGVVGIAGANPRGIGSGELATITFRRAKKGSRAAFAAFTIRLLEINSTGGGALLPGTRVYGMTSAGQRIAGPKRDVARATGATGSVVTRAGNAPKVDSIRPTQARLVSGNLVAIDVYGAQFAPAENQVLLSGTPISSVPSPTSRALRFILPTTFASNSEAPPRQLLAGVYEIQIRTAAGVSNAVRLVLESP